MSDNIGAVDWTSWLVSPEYHTEGAASPTSATGTANRAGNIETSEDSTFELFPSDNNITTDTVSGLEADSNPFSPLVASEGDEASTLEKLGG